MENNILEVVDKTKAPAFTDAFARQLRHYLILSRMYTTNIIHWIMSADIPKILCILDMSITSKYIK